MMTGLDHLLDKASFPKLCHISKWTGCDGYGFNLQGTTGEPGHFIGSVDPGSPAEATGLKAGDRLIEVNGVNIEGENHLKVIERIKTKPREAILLVVDEVTYQYYQRREVVITRELPNLREYWTPGKPQSDEVMKPKFCLLNTWSDFIGYGFTIQSDIHKKNPVVSQVDPESPAEYGGLRKGDKLVEVNDIPTFSTNGEIVYEVLLGLIKSNPEKLKLLVIEERFYNQFVTLRSEGSYRDDLIEVIICPQENPRINEDITFAIESSVSSVSASPREPLDHSTPKKVNLARDGTSNSTFVSDDSDDTTAVALVNPAAPANPATTGQTSPRLFTESKLDQITLKYCEIPSLKGMFSFGFNIVAVNPRPGNYFENVETSSPAQSAGLVNGDYLVSVNGALAYKDSHKEAVDKIKKYPNVVKVIVTDCEGFEKIYDRNERDVQELIDNTFDLKRKKALSVSLSTEGSIHTNTDSGDENSITHQKSEDDSISIDYKQVAEEMVQLALNEANQDNIKLETADKNSTLTRSNQLLTIPSSQSLEESPSTFESMSQKINPDYQSLPSSSKASISSQNHSTQVSVATLKFATTAAEARRNMKKKKDVKNSGMSMVDKFNLLKTL